MRAIARAVAAGCVLAVALFGAVACGGDDEGSAGGSQDAALTVYSGRDEELVAPLFDRFTRETGIAVDARYGTSAEMAATLVEEGDRSPADLFFSQDAGALGALEKEGLLAPLPEATLAEVARGYRSAAGRWVGTSGRARVIAYDKRVVRPAELPASVLDLTDERWRDKVGWVPSNASFQTFVTAMRKVHGEQAAERWLRDMAANGAQTYENNVAVRDAIANGEIELGLINHYYVAQAIAAADDPAAYPVAVHFAPGGDVGSLVNVAGAAVLASSERRDGALRLIDFMLSEQGQTFFRDETREYPLAAGVPSPDGVPPIREIAQPDVHLTDLDDLRGTLELIERVGVL